MSAQHHAKRWRSGPPPSVGWWPTLLTTNGPRLLPFIRWWNGARWSVPASQHQAEAGVLNALAESPTCIHNSQILWQPRPASWHPRSHT